MFRACLFALSLVLAMPVLAQDFATDYAAAVRPFMLPGATSLDQVDQLAGDAVMALLPEIEGDWVEVSRVHSAPFSPPSFGGDLVASICERLPVTLVQTSPRSFDLRHTRFGENGATMAVHYDFLFGNSFDRSVREEEAVAYLEMSEEHIALGRLAMPTLRDQVQLFHPSPDFLVLTSPLSLLEVYVRCPASE